MKEKITVDRFKLAGFTLADSLKNSTKPNSFIFLPVIRPCNKRSIALGLQYKLYKMTKSSH